MSILISFKHRISYVNCRTCFQEQKGTEYQQNIAANLPLNINTSSRVFLWKRRYKIDTKREKKIKEDRKEGTLLSFKSPRQHKHEKENSVLSYPIYGNEFNEMFWVNLWRKYVPNIPWWLTNVIASSETYSSQRTTYVEELHETVFMAWTKMAFGQQACFPRFVCLWLHQLNSSETRIQHKND